MPSARPLAIDLYCGLGGWADGLLAEGYEVIGFDIERHRYPARDLSTSDGTKIRQSGVDFNNPRVGSSANRSFNYANQCAVRDAPLTGGWIEYSGQLVIQDVRTLHGSQFRDAALIVASPPCQAYSYRAMPWKRAKALSPPDNTLFEACFRIQREACEAAGKHIPMVVENVRGAQKWVGRARWNFGSFYLWGDVPALMPIIGVRKLSPHLDLGGGRSFAAYGREVARYDPRHADRRESEAIKNNGGSWFAVAHNTTSGKGQNPDGRKIPGHQNQRDGQDHTRHLTNPGEHIKCGGDWFNASQPSISRLTSSRSPARKAATAMIAKIPLPLARHIAAVFRR